VHCADESRDTHWVARKRSYHL